MAHTFAPMDAADDIGSSVTQRTEPEGVGAFLRARRTELGLTYADVANVVKLPPRRIQALEDERWDELPDGPYLRGFLRNVARALDLNAAALMERVDESLMRSRNPESILVVPQGATHGTLPRRSGPVDDRRGGRKLIFGAFAFALIAALIAWSGTESFDRALTTGRGLIQSSSTSVETPIQPNVVVATPGVAASKDSLDASSSTIVNGTPTSVGTTASPAQSISATTEAVAAHALAFHFNEESWVEVRSADGRVLMQRLNAAGSDQQVDGEAPYALIVGNAKGVALRFRGQPVDLGPYTRDQVARLTLS
jgi:cytoskeleton protein RodZ